MGKLVIGKKAVLEQLKKNNILSVHAIKQFPEIFNKCKEDNIEYIIHDSEDFLKQISVNHQGIIAYLKDIDYLTENYNQFMDKIDSSKTKSIILIMDEIEDPGNVGNIIRTCDCMGVDGIILKKDNQCPIDNQTVIKVSQGALFNSNILKVTNLSQVIEKLKKDMYWIVSSSLEDNSTYLNETKFPDKIALIVGNEMKGISRNLINNSDMVVKIPMYGSSQSLNVTMATAILLYSIKHSS